MFFCAFRDLLLFETDDIASLKERSASDVKNLSRDEVTARYLWLLPCGLSFAVVHHFSKMVTTWAFQNKLGDTALHAAAWKGYSDIVELLLRKSEYLISPHVWFHKRNLIQECPASHKKPESFE